MSRPLVTYPRPVVASIDVLVDADIDAYGALPSDWTPRSTPVVTVHLDGTPNQTMTPVAIAPTIRLVAWSDSPTVSHDLVMAAAGHLEAHDGTHLTARLLNGPMDAVDPDHGNAELCAVTMRCRVRSTPLIASA